VADLLGWPLIAPPCPQHPDSVVQLDGYFTPTWTQLHRRPRYRCVTPPGTRGHAFSLPISVRQPTELHPDSGAACPHCEHEYDRHEGVKTGRWFVFGQQEIASLLMRVGEGFGLRESSKQLREEIERTNQGAKSKPAFKHINPGETSNQANLAVNYLDAYSPIVVDALLPKTWPRIVAIDSTTLMTRGYRAIRDRDTDPGDGEPEFAAGERKASLKAGTIMFAVDHTTRKGLPFRIAARGGKDVESWRDFFASAAGAPEWVIADLDPAIARAVRETWPKAILLHSRYHLNQLLRKNARADGVPEKAMLEEPVQLKKPIAWSKSRSRLRKYGPHPLMAAIDESQWSPENWAAFKELIEIHIPADHLELRSWIATNEVLIERQWEIIRLHGRIALSTGSVEGKMNELLRGLRSRAGRWQNVRRLNLVLALITLRARGEAREARYAGLIRRHFIAKHNASHLPGENLLGLDTDGRQMSWWRTWQDREQPSLPALVHQSEERTQRRALDDRYVRRRKRLEAWYETVDLRAQYGLAPPPRGRPKRPDWIQLPPSLKGVTIGDIPQLLDEWDWVSNGDLDPFSLPASSKKWAAWRCTITPDHVWEVRISTRAYYGRFCPYHMRVKVHPAESLASFYPQLALEWLSSAKGLRPDQVTHASAEVVTWRCELLGHEWQAPVYSRTSGGTNCPRCFALQNAALTKAGVKRGKAKRDEAVRNQLDERTAEQALSEFVLTFPPPDDEDF
jgi:hypothetical protein